MILENETITINRTAVKHYGGLGAIILQELYNTYGDTVTIDVPGWRESCLNYIPDATIKRVLTTLRDEGKIRMTDTTLYIKESTNEKSIKVPKTKKERDTNNPVWDMAVALCIIVGQSENFLTPNRYLKFAKQLIDSGKTVEYMEEKYGKDKWWYITTYKGQKGSPPNLDDIRKTIDDPIVVPDKKPSGFWR